MCPPRLRFIGEDREITEIYIVINGGYTHYSDVNQNDAELKQELSTSIMGFLGKNKGRYKGKVIYCEQLSLTLPDGRKDLKYI